MSIQETGWLGELRAASFARRQGMRLIARRWRCKSGEIDLIAQEGATLVFIEVKTRPRGAIGEGARAVNADKQRHVRAAARIYLQAHPWQGEIRFDVIEISAAGLRQIKNAF